MNFLVYGVVCQVLPEWSISVSLCIFIVREKKLKMVPKPLSVSLVLNSKFQGGNRLFCLGENICFIAVMKIILRARALHCLYRIHVYVLVLHCLFI